ncbi:citryl-CoA lyase [Bacillus sp. 1P02SD]|uniref:citryl-CoA lyase n=1 Tax=Bacillus sp. 1P02SD TaxID=3132264 RepID=UPI0039A3006D
MKFETSIGASEKDAVYNHGFNLAEDLIGTATLADMAFVGATHRMPTKNESDMINAVMVAIAEHGFTPSSVSTRLTYLGAPESVQGAIAAGLLGAGTVYLGAMEYVAEMVQKAVQKHEGKSIPEIAALTLDEYTAAGKALPGFGHPIHKPKDPRTIKLYQLAEEYQVKGIHLELLQEISRQFNERRGKEITVNVVGAIGAILSDMNIHYGIVKTFGVGARAIGLISHITEEIEHGRKNSIGQRLFEYIEENTDYQPHEQTSLKNS